MDWNVYPEISLTTVGVAFIQLIISLVGFFLLAKEEEEGDLNVIRAECHFFFFLKACSFT